MKVRIGNDKPVKIKVILEPWATEFFVDPGDFIEFRSNGKVPNSAYFLIEDTDYGLFVFPEWQQALVFAFDSDGNKLD